MPASSQRIREDANFLTKERHLGARTKVVLISILGCAVVCGFFYPSLITLFEWSLHRHSTYQGHDVELPIFWTQNLDSGGTSWERPPRHAFTYFDDYLTALPAPNLDTDARNLAVWHKFYGFAGANDLTLHPELQSLANLGMTCGSIKYGLLEGKLDGLMAVGCLTRDHKTTFTYTGLESDLHSAVSIVQQLQ
jgi:hypothetical protein